MVADLAQLVNRLKTAVNQFKVGGGKLDLSGVRLVHLNRKANRTLLDIAENKA